jgi:hypothetical protein
VGRPRLGRHLSGDYALFAVEQAVQSKWILLPDDRGSPEFRERVWLHGGVGDGSLVYGGTIYYSRSDAVWAVMEGEFNPALWSGSPFLSVETDRVVGMAVVAGHQRGRLVIGMHPIASLVEKALEAPP